MGSRGRLELVCDGHSVTVSQCPAVNPLGPVECDAENVLVKAAGVRLRIRVECRAQGSGFGT